jgi:uncharacterized protein (AIM24 family)
MQRFRKLTMTHENLCRKHLLFIQTNGSMVEKDLGSRESIVIRKEALIAYADTITLKSHDIPQK